MTVAGHKAKILIDGTSTAMSEEACSVVAGTSNATWEIDATAKEVFDHTVTFTVEASEDSGSTWATLGAAEFSLKYLLGRVDIDSYTSGSGTVANIDAVRISGSYLPRLEWLRGESITFSLPTTEHMTNVFGNEGEERHYGRKDFSADVDGISEVWTPADGVGGTEDSLADRIQNETPFVLEIQPNRDAPTQLFRAWVLIFGAGLDFSGGSLNSHSISMQGDQPQAAMTTQAANIWNYKA